MPKDFEARADSVFANANNALENDLKAILAEHSAKGLLRSGATIKKGIALYEERSRQALLSILDEQAKILTHRGRTWRAAGNAIGRSLERQISAAPELLARTFNIAGATAKSSAANAANAMIEEVAKGLRSQLREFQEGWSAPAPEKWTERHPLAYAGMLLVAGAIVGELVKIAVQ